MNNNKTKVIIALFGILIGGGLVFYLGSEVIPRVLVTVHL
jgi:hypothetical protein